MITDFMASAKQIAWRKKFAKMSKAGKFKKSKKSKSTVKSPSKKGMRKIDAPYPPAGTQRSFGIIYPSNFKTIGDRDNFAWVEEQGKKYQVITFRKHSTPQEFAHKNLSMEEAINYARSFNFLNQDT